jgi:hypothetical protein
MFDRSGSRSHPDSVVLDAAEVEGWVARLAVVSSPQDDGACLDLIGALERLKCAAEGLQADATVEVAASARERAAERVVPEARRSQGVAAEIALARRVSPHRGQQLLSLATVLHAELPHTRSALRAGRITEWRATIIARETACLARGDRMIVDRRVARDADALEEKGDRELGDTVRAMAFELDAEAWVTRRRIAESERRVTLRPAPDVMSRVSAELPVAQGVAAYAALGRRADALRAQGDPRSRSQLMADALVARLLGSDDSVAPVVPVVVDLVVPGTVLLGAGDQAAHLYGFGPVPGELARELTRAADEEGLAVLRRLYVRPESGSLVAMESRARRFPEGLARFIELRDQVCRTPWCDAPIRHHDHVVSRDEGGPTSAANGQGLCEACNYAKEAIGWRARPSPGDRHTVEIVTPAGRTYRSGAPPTLRLDLHFPLELVA